MLKAGGAFAIRSQGHTNLRFDSLDATYPEESSSTEDGKKSPATMMIPASEATPQGPSSRVFVVIVTYQAEAWIVKCIGSLVDSKDRPTIVVVDNASQDSTCSIIETQFPDVRLIRSTKNLGFGAGNNIGIEYALHAGADYIFLLNQDAYVSTTSIGQMRRYLDAHSDVGVASPLHCAADGKADERTLVDYVRRFFVEYLLDLTAGKSAEAYQGRGVNAAAWFVRASVFREFGGFDPLYFMYGEDDDLLARWAYHRVRFHLLPDAKVVHLRESAPSPPRKLLAEVRHRARRHRSTLLNRIMRPGHSLPHSLAVWLSKGLLEPFQLLPVRRNVVEFTAQLLAALTVAIEFPQLRAHQRITTTKGPHFLFSQTAPSVPGPK
jgi:GT2 family glycosyltransferase